MPFSRSLWLCIAVLSTSLSAGAALPPAPAGEVEVSTEARSQFQLGVSWLQDPDGARYEEAYKAFRKAYEASPSWKILGNLGLAAFKIERFGDGIVAYERYLQQGGDALEADERAQVERDLAVMKGSVATLQLKIDGAESVSVEDTRMRSVGGPIMNLYEGSAADWEELQLAAGKHVVVVSADGKRVTLELTLKAGEREVREVSLLESAPAPEAAVLSATTSEPSPHTKMRTAGLVVGGVGIAALVGGGVAALLGANKKKSLDAKCNDNLCSYSSDVELEALTDDRNSLNTLGALSTGLLIGGGVLTATGVTLYFVGGPKTKERVALNPVFSPEFAGFSAQGSF